ncbi:MAG TPA: hypothetical protein VLL08_02895 [Kineosporiaceae bacterium]|nr:hypothetical protein [Kineosporiaceae bacterium]
MLALTTAADLPQRVKRVVAVNPYDYRDGIARSSLLARIVIGNVLTPGIGPIAARVEPHAALSKILQGGLVDKSAMRVDPLLQLDVVGATEPLPPVGRNRPNHRGVWGSDRR